MSSENNKKSKSKKSKIKNKKNIIVEPNLKKKKKNPNKKKNKVLSRIFLVIKILFALFLMACVVMAGIIVGMLYGVWGDTLDITQEELTLSGNSVILDSDGNVLAELSGDENRKIITTEEMSEYLPKAYVAIEDERFYSHDGVDFKRTAGAIFTYLTHGGSSSYGGSTITQQLVKNITDDDAKSGKEGISRKIREWAKAYKIERMLSKDQILELYLNIIFVGDKYYGVEMGSEYYFGKSAKELSITECAFLAGINNSPNLYNPYSETSGKYGEDDTKTQRINTRTQTVLSKMKELGYITDEQYNDACKEVEKGITFKQGTETKNIYSYHTDAVISQVISDFVNEKGWTTEYATTYVYGGGLTIYSTQNTEIQKEVEEVFENTKKYQITSKSTGKKSQAAMTLIDNETGYVIALAGGLGEKDTSRGLNRATQSLRQTGSSIKPLADLVPGIDTGKVTAATKYYDNKTDFGNWIPKNQSGYSGEINLRVATGKSKNIPFIKVMSEVSNSVSRDYLKKMGITSLDDENDAGLSLAIGGLYKGISTLEMAGAYAAIENGGVYRTPLLYTKVVDSNGDVVYEPAQEKTQVCSEQTAYVVKDMMKSVVTASYGTASYCKISGIDVAAKTGTTNDDKDRWLCEFTNYYTAATWYGYDDPEEVKYSGANPAGSLSSAVFKKIHSDKSKSTFKKPDGIVTAKICSKTGLKATSKCSDTYSEIFVKGTVPDECDEGTSAVKICESSGLLANDYCPSVITKYYSYTLPHERKTTWKTYISSTSAPTQVCSEHTAKTKAQSNTSAPTIKISGNSQITINVGDSYADKGASATDEVDGDITSKIKTSGSVNTSKAGTYTVKYTVTNSRGKTTTATRTVIVKSTVKEETPKTDNDDKNTTKEPETPIEENTSTDKNTTTSTNEATP